MPDENHQIEFSHYHQHFQERKNYLWVAVAIVLLLIAAGIGTYVFLQRPKPADVKTTVQPVEQPPSNSAAGKTP